MTTASGVENPFGLDHFVKIYPPTDYRKAFLNRFIDRRRPASSGNGVSVHCLSTRHRVGHGEIEDIKRALPPAYRSILAAQNGPLTI